MFWRVEDIGAAPDASRDTGLPPTSPQEVADEVTKRVRRWLMEDPEPEAGIWNAGPLDTVLLVRRAGWAAAATAASGPASEHPP